MKNPKYYNGNRIPYAWSNLIFIDNNINEVTIMDIIEDSNNGVELVKKLRKLNMVYNKWVVDKETDTSVRIKNTDKLGNVTYIECEKQPQRMKEYEFTPREMAEKLLEFNRDFSTDSCDGEEEQKKELEVVTELFDKLQKSDEFNILALHLDLMFMDSAFD